jgi:two-component system, NarL family, response regulator DegU
MKHGKINVCITDDHPLIRQGIATILSFSERIGEVWEASDGAELLRLLKGYTPDVVLLDLQLPGMGGVEVCRLLNRDYPQVKIIILSMNDSPEMVELLIRLGAGGFISKGGDAQEVVQAIYAVHDHGRYTNDLVFDALRWVSSNASQPGTHQLSKRELEVVRLICEGLTMKAIGQRLNISEKTVQNHRANIMEKLGVHNTAGIVRFAVQNS